MGHPSGHIYFNVFYFTLILYHFHTRKRGNGAPSTVMSTQTNEDFLPMLEMTQSASFHYDPGKIIIFKHNQLSWKLNEESQNDQNELLDEKRPILYSIVILLMRML